MVRVVGVSSSWQAVALDDVRAGVGRDRRVTCRVMSPAGSPQVHLGFGRGVRSNATSRRQPAQYPAPQHAISMQSVVSLSETWQRAHKGALSPGSQNPAPTAPTPRRAPVPGPDDCLPKHREGVGGSGWWWGWWGSAGRYAGGEEAGRRAIAVRFRRVLGRDTVGGHDTEDAAVMWRHGGAVAVTLNVGTPLCVPCEGRGGRGMKGSPRVTLYARPHNTLSFLHQNPAFGRRTGPCDRAPGWYVRWPRIPPGGCGTRAG